MNKIIYVSTVILSSLIIVACGSEAEAPDQPPATTVYVEKPCAEAGAPAPDTGPPVEVLDPCNGQFYRGMCDDRLLPFVWGFDKRCEDEGRVAYKSCANPETDYKCAIRPATREKCVEAAGNSANQIILCCPEQ